MDGWTESNELPWKHMLMYDVMDKQPYTCEQQSCVHTEHQMFHILSNWLVRYKRSNLRSSEGSGGKHSETQ